MGAIGLTGTKTRGPEGGMVECYDLTLGGSQGKDPQIGILSRKGVTATEIKNVLREVLIEQFGATAKQTG